MNDSVSITRCHDYKPGNVKKAVEDAIDYLGGIERFVPKNSKVLIKTNMLSAKEPSHAITTHPEVLRQVIRIVKKQTTTIVVGDSPGFGTMDNIAEKTGIKAVCKEEGVMLMDITENTKYENKNSKILKVFNASTEAKKADVIINLPKLKTHSFTTYTGAVKNFFGFIPGKEKMKMHLKLSDPELFSHMLIDINTTIKSSLTIMDAVDIMEGDGPSSGEKRSLGLIIASDSNFACDAAATTIVDINRLVPTVQLAIKRGIKEADIKNVHVKGEKISDVKIKTPLKLPKSRYGDLSKNPAVNLLKRFFTDRPVLKKEDCTKCRTCYQVCPSEPKSITFNQKTGYPQWDYKTCIRCYTCAEYCPAKAIKIKKGL